MTTIDRLISSSAAAAAVPTPWAKAGLPAGAPLPIGALSAWETDLRLWVRSGNTEQEADSIWIKVDKLEAGFADQLTEIEQARDTLAGLTTLADMAQKFRNAKGESTVSTEDFNAFLDRLLALAEQKAFTPNGDTPGSKSTQAPAAPPATPNTNEPTPPETEAQRRARFDEVLKQSGFKWPDDSIAIGNMGLQHGFTLDEVNRWTTPGA